jgi:hypothetical protein
MVAQSEITGHAKNPEACRKVVSFDPTVELNPSPRAFAVIAIDMIY